MFAVVLGSNREDRQTGTVRVIGITKLECSHLGLRVEITKVVYRAGEGRPGPRFRKDSPTARRTFPGFSDCILFRPFGPLQRPRTTMPSAHH